ncbi:AMP dependent coa ligase [Anopheles sinensis]|uniref:AMP dependent coa ligase n=1 Tax=Anopheles sinensis TaxID=74873 RepID=A0A084W5F1_ANOSI|nr:AMP dependent coa ligase [Anopheles sinensis]
MAESKKLAAHLRTRQSVLNMMSALEAFQASFSDNDAVEVPVRLELVNKCYEDFLEISNKIESLDGDGKSSSETGFY